MIPMVFGRKDGRREGGGGGAGWAARGAGPPGTPPRGGPPPPPPPPTAPTHPPPQAKDIRQTKLRVVLVGPPKPPSPVPEGVEDSEAASPGLHGPAAAALRAPAAADDAARERDRLRDALARAEREKAGVQARLDALARGGGGATATRAGYGVLHLLVVAVLAFLAGAALVAARAGVALLPK